ncbi:MAG: hypothetical protein QW518_09615, partial [Thermofilaceae archaeon]
MENQKIITLFFLLLFFLNSCSKSPSLEPLKLPKREDNATIILEEPNASKKVESLSSPQPLEALSPQRFDRVWKRGPLPPPPPPVQEKKEEEKKEDPPPIRPSELLGVKDPVYLNVENMPLSDFIIYVLGELLKVPFLIDEDVKNMRKPITLRMPQSLPPEDVLLAVVDYLVKQELQVQQKGRVLSITKPRPKPTPPPPPPPQVEAVVIDEDIPETSGIIAFFYPLRYVRPGDIDFFLRDVFRAGVEIRTYGKENAFYLQGPGHLIKKVVELIRILDIPYFAQRKLYLMKLNYWDPETLTLHLTDLLGKL